MTVRKLLLWSHLAVGLITAPLLLVLGLSGAVLVWERPLDDLLNPRLSRVTPTGAPLALSDLERQVTMQLPGTRVHAFWLPDDDRHAVRLSVARAQQKDERVLFVDPYRGRILGTDEERNEFVDVVHQLHVRLAAGATGATLVAYGAVALAWLALSGLVLWWPRKLAILRWRGSWRLRLLDLHQVVGAWSFVSLFVVAVTGVVIHWEPQTQRLLGAITGAPLAPLRVPDSGCDGQAPQSPDQLLAAATAAAPGARATSLQLGPRGTARVTLKYPEDKTPSGRTNVFVAVCSARVLLAQSSRGAPAAFRATRMWNRALHTGDALGLPTRLLSCIGSLSAPLLAITGPLLWWTRRRRLRAGAAITSQPASAAR